MPSRTSELNAVNTMLSVIGEPPINSLTGTQNADAAIAQNILDEVAREVQGEGWHFNTLHNQTLSPDSSGEIILAAEVLRIDNDTTVPPDSSSTIGTENREVIQRGTKLFDKTNNTFTFTSSVRCAIVYVYDFEELPEAARRYITVRAARIFQDRMVGSVKGNAFTLRDEQKALATLREFEGDTSDRTIFDNIDTFQIINRRSGIRGSGY